MLFRVHKEALRRLTLLDEAIDPSTYLTPSSKPLSVSLCIDSVARALARAYTRPADQANLTTCCRFTRTSRTPSQRELLKRIKRGRGKLRRRSQLVDARLHKSVINRHYHWLCTACQNDQVEGDAKRACNPHHGFRCNESYDFACPHLPQHPKTWNAMNGDDRRQRNVASHGSRNHMCSDKHW